MHWKGQAQELLGKVIIQVLATQSGTSTRGWEQYKKCVIVSSQALHKFMLCFAGIFHVN